MGKKKAAPAPVLVTAVLDRSGSMGVCKAETIEALNGYVAELQADKTGGDVWMTLRQFDTFHDLLYRAVPIDLAPILTDAVYQPRGSTALNDAIAFGVADAETVTGLPEGIRHLLLVVTDGFENASQEHTAGSIKSLLASKEATGVWTVVFLQGGLDRQSTVAASAAVMDSYGVSAGNMAMFVSASPGSTSSVVGATARATTSLRSAKVGQTVSFYDDAGEMADNTAPVWNADEQRWEAAKA